MTKPHLSIVLFGRNDNYTEDYTYRLETCINTVSLHAEANGCLHDIEILFVDWGSESPMADALVLSEAAASVTRFIEVRPEVIEELGVGPHIYVNCAVNVGVRRARGHYVMLSDTDSIFSRNGFYALMRLLRGESGSIWNPITTLFNLRRYQIPLTLVRRQPSASAWFDIVEKIQPMARLEMQGAKCVGGFAGAQLMHASLWEESRGYDEALRAGWGGGDNDLTMRVNTKYPWADPSALGVELFHMEHLPPSAPSQGASRTINIIPLHATIAANDANWGLGERDLPERRGVAGNPSRRAAARVFSDKPFLPLTGMIRRAQDVYALIHSNLFHSTYDTLCAIMRGSGFTHLGGNPNHPLPSHVDLRDMIFTIGMFERPLNAFIFGGDWRGPIETVARTCPAATIFAIDILRWVPAEQANEQVSLLSIVLDTSNYRGYGQILNGPAEEALGRINGQHGRQEIDLAILNVSSFPEKIETLLMQVLAQLSPRGLVVLHDPECRMKPIDSADSNFFNAVNVLLEQMGMARQSNLQIETYIRQGITPAAVCVLPSGGVALIRRTD